MTKHIFTLLHDINSPLTKLQLLYGKDPQVASNINRIVTATRQLGLLFSLEENKFDKATYESELKTLETQLDRQIQTDPDKKHPSTQATEYLIDRVKQLLLLVG